MPQRRDGALSGVPVKLKDTWKDEAIAFCFLAASLVFAMRSWSFFAASQKSEAPKLQTYEKPRVEPERTVEYVHVNPSHAFYVTGSAVAFGGVLYGNGEDGMRVLYRHEGDEP